MTANYILMNTPYQSVSQKKQQSNIKHTFYLFRLLAEQPEI